MSIQNPGIGSCTCLTRAPLIALRLDISIPSERGNRSPHRRKLSHLPTRLQPTSQQNSLPFQPTSPSSKWSKRSNNLWRSLATSHCSMQSPPPHRFSVRSLLISEPPVKAKCRRPTFREPPLPTSATLLLPSLHEKVVNRCQYNFTRTLNGPSKNATLSRASSISTVCAASGWVPWRSLNWFAASFRKRSLRSQLPSGKSGAPFLVKKLPHAKWK